MTSLLVCGLLGAVLIWLAFAGTRASVSPVLPALVMFLGVSMVALGFGSAAVMFISDLVR